MRHGSRIDPPNRFESVHRDLEREQLEWDEESRRQLAHRPIEYLFDDSKSIVSENTSPDIPFRYSVNPYRGCAHACPYCYARNTHEYLGFNAGLDFETKIVVKRDAPGLLRKFLDRPSWQGERITFSGVTDCYQPAEREFRLTRGCLEVAREYSQPVSIVTKNALVLRDLDLLTALARDNLVHVFLSVTTLDSELAGEMEPRTSTPAARLRAIETLSAAGVPVGVMTAPIIPGLNDSELPELLRVAKEAGAAAAGYVFLRLPSTVEPVFREWLGRTHPERQSQIENRIRGARDGQLNGSQWGERMRGTGEIADQIAAMFRLFTRRYGLDKRLPPHDSTRFCRPRSGPCQMRLF